MKNFLRLLCLISFFTPSFAGAQIMQENENSTGIFLISHVEAKPGDTIEVGIMIEPKAGWHTHWENPGDAGLASTMEWILPEGATAGPIQWQVPDVIMEDTLAVYGYKHPSIMRADIHVPGNYSEPTFPIQVKSTWLICKDICVPEEAQFAVSVKMGPESYPGNDKEMLDGLRARDPQALSAIIPYTVTNEHYALELPPGIAPADDTYFFVREMNQVKYAGAQKTDGQTLYVPRSSADSPADILTGLLVSGGKTYDIRAEKKSGAAVATGNPNAPSSQNFLLLLLFAALGGLILNLMPCVLPVLSLKAIAIVKKSGHDRSVVVRQSLAYTAGVMISFAVIAGVLIALQMAGESIGWGFQMQSPPFVGFLIILLFLVGMNLLGMFHLPVLLGNVMSDTPHHSTRGSFLTGVLAVAVATPCTAPFMATAVGATIGLPAIQSLLIFLSLGLGLALPFLLIGLFPKLVSYLPKPGAWMEVFKQLMAFPMFASVIWLLWVLTRQTGAAGLLTILITLLVIGFLIWLRMVWRDRSRLCMIAMLLVVLAALANGLVALSKLPPPEAGAPAAGEESYSPERLAELRASGTPVFVDATAAWCLICQVNAKTSIKTEEARAAFEDTGTVLLIADWTNRDPMITDFLKSFGYNGVPLYVYYPASGEPVVLPQLLSESLVISTLKGEP